MPKPKKLNHSVVITSKDVYNYSLYTKKYNIDEYDDKTKKMITKLLKDYKKDKLSYIDKVQLKRLLDKEFTANDIENEIIKCKKDIFYFINNYIYVKNKFPSMDKVPEHLKDKVIYDIIKVILYDVQEEFIDNIVKYDKIGAVKSRQTGGTTTAIEYFLQVALFQSNKELLILSKSEDDAKNTLSELKFMYNYLPFFLKRNVLTDNVKTFELGKKGESTKIRSLTAGKSSGRSISATIILLDEAEFIQQVDELYGSVAPTISATGGKIIMISTPQEYQSFFYKIVNNAKNNGFKITWFYWYKIPNRDKQQYEEQCKILNYDKKKIKTELDCEQILPYDTYLDSSVLEEVKFNLMKPLKTWSTKEFYMYERYDKDYNYLISIDTKEFGNDYFAISVFKYDVIEKDAYLVAEGIYDRDDFSIINDIEKVVSYYPTAHILIERNRGFAIINLLLNKDDWYKSHLLQNIKFDKRLNRLTIAKGEYGLTTTKSNRNVFFTYLSKYFNTKKDKVGMLLFEEAKELIIKNNKPVGLKHDDIIMSFVIGYYYINILFENPYLLKDTNLIGDLKFRYIDSIDGNENTLFFKINEIIKKKNQGVGLTYNEEALLEWYIENYNDNQVKKVNPSEYLLEKALNSIGMSLYTNTENETEKPKKGIRFLNF